MLCLELRKAIGWTGISEGTAGVEIRQHHRFLWAEDLGGLRHEMHPAKHDHLGIGVGGFAGEFQGITDEVGDVLDGVVLVVVRQDHGTALLP